MTQMYRITYISKSALNGDKAQIQAEVERILNSAHANNPEMGVTGALLYSGGYFCQVIEGEEENLEELYETIQMDPRHSNVTILTYEECDERIFADWSMAYAGISEEDRLDLDGIKDSKDEVILAEKGNNILELLEESVKQSQQ